MVRKAIGSYNALTLFCDCGRSFAGRNIKAVHKLFELHNKLAHNTIVKPDMIQMIDKHYDSRTNGNNPTETNGKVSLYQTHEVLHNTILIS